MATRELATPQFLLEGAVYALQNSGDQMRDAVLLFNQGSYPNSIVLAMIGREELGKFNMLQDEFNRIAAGEDVYLDDVRKSFRGRTAHLKKQEMAVLSTVVRTQPGEPLYDLL